MVYFFWKNIQNGYKKVMGLLIYYTSLIGKLPWEWLVWMGLVQVWFLYSNSRTSEKISDIQFGIIQW